MKILPQSAVTCIMVSGGYPDKYAKGYVINGIEETAPLIVFNAGTALKDGKLVTSGGRVLALTALERSLEEARDAVYSRIGRVSFDGAFHRSDIALDMINWPGRK